MHNNNERKIKKDTDHDSDSIESMINSGKKDLISNNDERIKENDENKK